MNAVDTAYRRPPLRIESGSQRYSHIAYQKFLVVIMLVLGLAGAHGISEAHDPHDVIDAIHVVPDRNGDGSTIYVIRGYDTLLRSTDAGASWKELHNGIDNRHRLTDISGVSRRDGPAVLFLATDGDGIFLSEDGGEGWCKAGRNGLGTSRFSRVAAPYSQTNAGIVVAVGMLGGLYRSDDFGSNWKRVLAEDITVKSVEFYQDAAGSVLLIGDAAGRIASSRDAGENWVWVTLPADVGAITALQPVPGSSGFEYLLVGTEHGGVYRWRGNKEDRLEPSGKGMVDKSIVDYLLVSSNPLVVGASTRSDGVYLSRDGGHSWQLANTGLTKSKQAEQGVFRSPNFREMEIDRSDPGQVRIYLAGFDGLFVTTDPEHGWMQLETEPVGRILGMSVSPEYGERYLTAVTTYGAGVYTRPSDSDTWRIKTLGLTRPRVGKIVFTPAFQEDGIMYSLEDEGSHLLRSRRGTLSWASTELGPYWVTDLKRRFANKLKRLGLSTSITTDLLTRRENARSAHPKVIAARRQSEDAEELFVGTRWRGLFHSGDGGVTVERINGGLDEVWDLAILPQDDFPPILLATGREKGVYRSTDGGTSWKAAEQGLGFLREWRTPLADDSRRQFELGRSKFYNLHLFVPTDYRKTVFLYGGEGLFLTRDGGLSWIEAGATAFGQSRFVLAVGASSDFEHDGTLLLSLKGSGLWISRDWGATFKPFGRDLILANHEIHTLDFSPNYAEDQTIYAASREDLFVSSDGGDCWEIISRPIRYESERGDVIKLTGAWARQRGSQFSSGAAVRLKGHDSTLELAFVGTGVRIIAGSEGDFSDVEVLIDGKPLSLLHATRNEITGSMELLSEGLTYGRHAIRIALKVAPEEVATQPSLVIDALDVLGNRKPQTVH